ncbi:hypothetical protein P3S68_006936 [Capsicum galapagoense]
MRDVDKASAASKEKISLSKFDLNEIKSFVSTYIDMKFNDLQKLMADQYTGLLRVVKEGFASFGKVAQYPVHESEKGYPYIKEDPPQSVNEHTTDAKSYNVESEEALHNTNEELSKSIILYISPSRAAYPTEITAAANIGRFDRQSNIDSQCYISDNDIAAISQVPVCKTNLTYVMKNPSRRNRQPSKVCQSPYVSVFDSGSKEKEVIQSNKKLKYPFEGHDINGPYAEDLLSKFTVWMSSGLYNPHATKKGKDEYYTAKFVDPKPSLNFKVAQPVKKS